MSITDLIRNIMAQSPYAAIFLLLLVTVYRDAKNERDQQRKYTDHLVTLATENSLRMTDLAARVERIEVFLMKTGQPNEK